MIGCGKSVPFEFPLSARSGGKVVEHANQLEEHLPPCNNIHVSLKNTWTQHSPVGYLYRNKWHSTQCNSTFDGSPKALKTCLSGKYVWIFGDSTTRQFFVWFYNRLNMRMKTEKWNGIIAWHKPSNATTSDGKFNTFWGIHALPFYGTVDEKTPSIGTHAYLDNIPAHSKGIAILHFSTHFVAFHPDIIRKHMRKTKDSAQALLKRAPELLIVVKGCHAYTERKTPSVHVDQFYDFWGKVYDRIWKEEFSVLMNDVLFLDVWDITMSGEAVPIHPPDDTILTPLINHMLSFYCY